MTQVGMLYTLGNKPILDGFLLTWSGAMEEYTVQLLSSTSENSSVVGTICCPARCVGTHTPNADIDSNVLTC